jgi:hypothetical protein
MFFSTAPIYTWQNNRVNEKYKQGAPPRKLDRTSLGATIEILCTIKNYYLG